MKDILDTAISTGSFTTLVTAARAAGLDETLKSEGPYTIFAPTDEAFAKLPPGTIDAWLSDVPTLISLLSYHIVPGKVLEDDVLEIEFAQTILGEELTIDLDPEDNLQVNNAKVIESDIVCGNGVIHVIDQVLLPK